MQKSLAWDCLGQFAIYSILYQAFFDAFIFSKFTKSLRYKWIALHIGGKAIDVGLSRDKLILALNTNILIKYQLILDSKLDILDIFS